MRQERAAAAKFGGSMGDSETAQQGSAGEHAGDVTGNGHAGDVADDEVVGAVPPGAFSPAATLPLHAGLTAADVDGAQQSRQHIKHLPAT